MKNRYIISCFLIFCLCLVGCESSEKPKQEESKEHNEKTEVTDEKFSQKEAEILKFVDVFGNPYEVEINPNIAKKKYQDNNFTREGDKLSYEDDNFSSRLGVDVSYHQGSIDWEKVKADGYNFAMIRIGYRGYGTEGTLNLDTSFHENISNAQSAGLDVGVYFFAQAINEEEALEEAEFVLEYLNGYQLQLPVVYDPESILDDEARTDNVTGEQFTKNTEVFCKRIQEAGYDPMIYSNMLWEAYELDLEQLAAYPIWYADYEPLPQTPYDFTMWQYSNTGTVDGIEGATDLNIQFIEK